MAQVETVQQIYQEFGRGDIPAILSHLAEDVEWEYGNNSTDVPWLQLRRGRTHVAEFLQALADFEVRRFEPKTFLESGNVVVALIDVEATVRAPDEALSRTTKSTCGISSGREKSVGSDTASTLISSGRRGGRREAERLYAGTSARSRMAARVGAARPIGRLLI
jgi:ketosteroid isomerase-like protein